ncbi:MAG: hypothetical protein WC889_02720, partial [Myxococcota bacterium]
MDDIAEIVSGLNEAEKRCVRRLGAEIMLANELARKCGERNGHRVGHFARRSPLFETFGRTKNYTALWQLTPLGARVRSYLENNRG